MRHGYEGNGLHHHQSHNHHTDLSRMRRTAASWSTAQQSTPNCHSMGSTTPRRDNSPASPTQHQQSPVQHHQTHHNDNSNSALASVCTQVSRDGSQNQVAQTTQPQLHWPKEFLPPEPDPRTFTPLLPPKDRSFGQKNTLVLDLDETLVHSSFKAITLVDMLIDIELEGETHTVYVRKRPWVEDFLARVSELYEVVVLTASLEVYADPVLDELDPDGFWVHHRLFRDSCANLNGNYIKDLSYLGRPLHQVIIIDNAPTSYLFQPRNALPISSWFDDPSDTELRDLVPVLERAAKVDNVYPVLDGYRQATANGERWYP